MGISTILRGLGKRSRCSCPLISIHYGASSHRPAAQELPLIPWCASESTCWSGKLVFPCRCSARFFQLEPRLFFTWHVSFMESGTERVPMARISIVGPQLVKEESLF